MDSAAQDIDRRPESGVAVYLGDCILNYTIISMSSAQGEKYILENQKTKSAKQPSSSN